MTHSPEQLSDSCITWSSAIWQTRTTLVRLPGGSILFDPTYFPTEIETIAAVSERSTADGESILVFTHSDWDHIVGASAFPERRCIAHRAVHEKSEAERLRIVDEIRSFDSQWYVERPIAPEYPGVDRPIPAEEALELAGEPCLLVPAIGHTDDGIATFFPRLHLLVGGDLLSALEFPFIYHSAFAYRRTLERIRELVRELDTRLLVPGHGPPARDAPEIERRLSDDLDYLDRLMDRVGSMLQAGVGGEDLVMRLSSFPFRGAPIGAAQIEFHEANVRVVEKECAGTGRY